MTDYLPAASRIRPHLAKPSPHEESISLFAKHQRLRCELIRHQASMSCVEKISHLSTRKSVGSLYLPREDAEEMAMTKPAETIPCCSAKAP